jgi:hypothetical protein
VTRLTVEALENVNNRNAVAGHHNTIVTACYNYTTNHEMKKIEYKV